MTKEQSEAYAQIAGAYKMYCEFLVEFSMPHESLLHARHIYNRFVRRTKQAHGLDEYDFTRTADCHVVVEMRPVAQLVKG